MAWHPQGFTHTKFSPTNNRPRSHTSPPVANFVQISKQPGRATTMKISPTFFAISLLFALLLAACKNGKLHEDGQHPACNFYYWKTTLAFGKEDKALADSLAVKKLYVRYFDVDWSPSRNMAVPVGEIVADTWERSWIWENNGARIQDLQLVPTVFLTNRVFSQDIQIDTLAGQVSQKIREITDHFRYLISPYQWRDMDNAEVTDWEAKDSLANLIQSRFLERITEIQLDCDWTPSTRERYFAFINAMKKKNPGMAISCTVRLHQFRDREAAGIPPVDQATLMCYNVAPPKDPAVNDAIFDAALVNGYLKNGTYPLPLEAALPMFSWGALFHENQFKGLASGLSKTDVENNPLFVAVGENRYRFTQDTVFSEVYMRQGNIVRLDAASPQELEQLAGQLAAIDAVYGLSFFDWDAENIRAFQAGKVFEKFVSGK
ncbi:MAG: hypothetical protein R2788_23825 [Saprospiraceae bacterium]